MEERRNKRLYKVLLVALKVIPMLLALCAVLDMITEFLGYDIRILSMIGGVSFLPLVFLYLASYVFQFCVYHRMFLHYVLANNILIYLDYYMGIPLADKSLFMFHIIVIGIFLYLILYFYRKEKCCR